MSSNKPLREPERILQRLDWTVIRRLDGMLQGDYHSIFQGFGLDLSDLREYQFGDDPRTIDWNVTARMREPYVRKYLEDREISAWFLVDLSPSLDFGTVDNLKRDMVLEFVAVLARLLTRHGNAVGACLYDGRNIRTVPSRHGRNQVLHLIRELREAPKMQRTPDAKLASLVEAAGRIVRRKSLVFLVSDFISPPGWERGLSVLSRMHETLAIRVHDPRESDLPDLGPLWLEDAESGEQIYVDTQSTAFRIRFREAALKREELLRQTFKASGVDTLSLSTQDDLVKAILRFAELRKNMRNKARSGAVSTGGRPVRSPV